MLNPDNDNQHSVFNDTIDVFQLIRQIKAAKVAKDMDRMVRLRADLIDMCHYHPSGEVRRMACRYIKREHGIDIEKRSGFPDAFA